MRARKFLFGMLAGGLMVYFYHLYTMREIRESGSEIVSMLIAEKAKRKNDSIEYNEMLDMCQQRIIEITENTK